LQQARSELAVLREALAAAKEALEVAERFMRALLIDPDVFGFTKVEAEQALERIELIKRGHKTSEAAGQSTDTK
jgi:hypothetical protein